MPASRIVVAPDSFKGSIDARGAADAIRIGWQSVRPHDDVTVLPQADGGEGTLDALAAAVPGARRSHPRTVTGPDGRPVNAQWLTLPDGGVLVELALTSGLPLMRTPDPLGATTRGLGELITGIEAPALSIALGGSATTDGGAGALTALGLELTDGDGAAVPPGGGGLRYARSVSRAGLVTLPPVDVLTDVHSPLLGPEGAAHVFAPQKGAGPREVEQLESGLANLASLLGGSPEQEGAGAAGGTAYGFAAVYAATIRSGSDYVARVSGLDEATRGADLVITGEGRFDTQSFAGKVVGRVLSRARRVAVIAGQVAADPGCWSVALSELAGSTQAALADPVRWLSEAGAAAARAHR